MGSKKLAIVIPAYNEELSIERTLQGLSDQERAMNDTHIFVVDNGSTDNTRKIIDTFKAKHRNFPLTVLTEKQKGTGAAADTGFRYAIQKGYPVIARTDADTVPLPDWTSRIYDNFYGRNPPRLLAGETLALHDEHFRPADTWLVPLVGHASRYILAIQHFNPNHVRTAHGYNMATTAETYLAVDGFPRISINQGDEDIAYTVKVADAFGKKSIHIDWDLKVRTSARRKRIYGVFRAAMYYLFPSKRRGDVDVR